MFNIQIRVGGAWLLDLSQQRRGGWIIQSNIKTINLMIYQGTSGTYHISPFTWDTMKGGDVQGDELSVTFPFSKNNVVKPLM